MSWLKATIASAVLDCPALLSSKRQHWQGTLLLVGGTNFLVWLCQNWASRQKFCSWLVQLDKKILLQNFTISNVYFTGLLWLWLASWYLGKGCKRNPKSSTDMLQTNQHGQNSGVACSLWKSISSWRSLIKGRLWTRLKEFNSKRKLHWNTQWCFAHRRERQQPDLCV